MVQQAIPAPQHVLLPYIRVSLRVVLTEPTGCAMGQLEEIPQDLQMQCPAATD